MALGGQVHDRIRRVRGEDPVEARAVADIGLFEGVKRALGGPGHVVETGGIGQRIEIDDRVPVRHRAPHHRRADEARAARDEDFHVVSFVPTCPSRLCLRSRNAFS